MMKKTVLSTALASALAFTLVGCADKESTAKDSADQPMSLHTATQADINALGQQLDLDYTVIKNHAGDLCDKELDNGQCFQGKLELTVPEDMPIKDWDIYFSHIQPIFQVDSPEFTVTHVKGDLHRLEPTDQFKGFAGGETQTVAFLARVWHLSETDPMPNYYAVADGLKPKTIASTVPQKDPETGLEILPHVTEFTNSETHFKRADNDKTQWATSSVLFENNKNITPDATVVDTGIVPTPTFMEVDASGARLDLKDGLALSLHDVEQGDLQAVLDRLASLGINNGEGGVETHIRVKADDSQAAGSYQLTIANDRIDIEAVDAAGAFYGLQSIASLVTLGRTDVPLVKVMDSPRFDFRGMHIDVSRNFKSTDFVFTLLDQMAAYKMNKFHFHLADDEGWRLEVPGLPELTDIGSKRCHDLEEQNCLLPQLGHGHDASSPASGYYSVDDYKAILSYAEARHIQVIPSLDMPGHARAAVKAMQSRYNSLMAAGKEAEAAEYLLTDFNNTSVYATVQYYDDNTINACMESSYTFIEKIMDEMIAMHKDAGQPLTRYHIGADETEHAWDESPICEEYKAANPQITDLGGYFIERVAKILDERGVIAGGWSDGMSKTVADNMPETVHANSWQYLGWGISATNELANRGWELVLSTPDALYFDFPYEADPKERGYYWASRSTNTAKVFSMMPENLPVHAEFWPGRNGDDFTVNDTKQTDDDGKVTHTPLNPGVTFAGMQGHVWSETVRTDDQTLYMTFPRVLAIAERAWHKADWEVPYNYDGGVFNKDSGNFKPEQRAAMQADFNRFANILGHKTLAKLDHFDVFYRLPTVGAKVMDGKLHANIIFPGLAIEYRINGGTWNAYTAPVAVEGSVDVRAISPNGERKSRTLTVK